MKLECCGYSRSVLNVGGEKMVGNAAISFRHFTRTSRNLSIVLKAICRVGGSLYIKSQKFHNLLSQIMLRLHLRQQPSPS